MSSIPIDPLMHICPQCGRCNHCVCVNQKEILHINLNERYDECHICGDVAANCGIPMYEDMVLPNDWSGEWYGQPACQQCFELQETITKWLPMSAYDFVKIRGR